MVEGVLTERGGEMGLTFSASLLRAGSPGHLLQCSPSQGHGHRGGLPQGEAAQGLYQAAGCGPKGGSHADPNEQEVMKNDCAPHCRCLDCWNGFRERHHVTFFPTLFHMRSSLGKHFLEEAPVGAGVTQPHLPHALPQCLAVVRHGASAPLQLLCSFEVSLGSLWDGWSMSWSRGH
jgi:hypothetical protein